MRKFTIPSAARKKHQCLCVIRRNPAGNVSVRTCGCSVGGDSVSSLSSASCTHRRRIASEHMTVKKCRAGGRKSLSHCRHFWLRASTLMARLFFRAPFHPPPPSSLRQMSTGFSWFSRGDSTHCSFWLVRSSFFSFPSISLRGSCALPRFQ